MSCNIVINQSSLPTHEAKVKDPDRQRRGIKSHETYMKRLRERFSKDNEEAWMTLKESIDYFQDLNDSASTLMAMEETVRIMKEEHNTEINISIKGTDHAKNV